LQRFDFRLTSAILDHIRELPSGTVTFRFTDIEGSTKRQKDGTATYLLLD
jgi:hypothetical protein